MPGVPIPDQATLADPNFTTATPPFDRSGKITIDPDKVANWSTSIHFAQEGYRERFTNSDDQEASFVIDVPWGYLAATRQYFLGYSWVDPSQNADGSYQLHRVPAFQCPKQGYEHLYCSSFDAIAAEGYVVLDPYIFVRDKQGQVVTGADDAMGNPIPTPAFFPAWADRSTATDGNAKCRVTCRPRPFLVRNDSDNLALQGGELNRYVSRTPLKPAIQSLSLAGNLNPIVWGPDATGFSVPTIAQNIATSVIAAGGTAAMVIAGTNAAAASIAAGGNVAAVSAAASAAVTANGGNAAQAAAAANAVTATGTLAGQAIPAAAQYILMPTIEVNMTWYQVPSPPFTALRQAMGKINSADFDFGALLGSPWGAGKLLCVAPPAWKLYRQCTGLFAWDCYFSFLYRDQGWNFYPDSSGNFFSIIFQSSGQPVYKSFDFNKLFQSGPPIQWD